MIVSLKNPEGYVYAYVEFEVVDYETRLTDDGQYLYVQNIWIHQDCRGNGILKKLIPLIFEKSKKAEFVYWHREKYSRESNILLGSKFIKYLKKER